MHVLLVEPDARSAEAVGDNLSSSMGAQVSVVASRKDALSLLEVGTKPDVALIAWDERGSAAGLVSALRGQRPNLPIVLMLADGAKAEGAIVDALGVKGNVAKHAAMPELSRVLRDVAKFAFEAEVLNENATPSQDDDLPDWLGAVRERWCTQNASTVPPLTTPSLDNHCIPSPAEATSISTGDKLASSTDSADIPVWLPPGFASAPTWLSPSPVDEQKEDRETESTQVEVISSKDPDASSSVERFQGGEFSRIDWVAEAAKASSSVIRKIINFLERTREAGSETSKIELKSYDELVSPDSVDDDAHGQPEKDESPRPLLELPDFLSRPEPPTRPATLRERLAYARASQGLPQGDFSGLSHITQMALAPRVTLSSPSTATATVTAAYRRMRQTLILVVVGLAVAGALIAEFVPGLRPMQNPAGPLTRVHQSDALGVSVTFPQTWLVEDVEESGVISPGMHLILAAEHQDALGSLHNSLVEGTFVVRQPVFVGMVSSQEGMSEVNPRDLMDVFMSEQPMADLRRGEMRRVRVGDEYGVQTEFSASDPVSGDRIRGRVVAVVWAEQVGFLVGAAPADEWRTFAPTFDEIVASTELFEPMVEVESPVSSLVNASEFTAEDGRETSAVWQINVNGGEQQSRMEDGNYAHNWIFESGEDWTVTISVRALHEAYDPFLTLIGSDGEVLAQDDDSGGGQWNRDAQLRTTLPAGTYIVRVNSFGADGVGGEYTINVTSP